MKAKLNFEAKSEPNFYMPVSTLAVKLKVNGASQCFLLPKKVLGKDWGEFTINWTVAVKETKKKIKGDDYVYYEMAEEDIYDYKDKEEHRTNI